MVNRIGYVLLVLLIIVNPAIPATYYVDQSGNGTGAGTTYANRASLADYENGSTGTFDSSDLNGHTVCFYDGLTPAADQFDLGECGQSGNADPCGTSGSPIILNGSATGACAGGGGQAQVNGIDGTYAMYAIQPDYLTITGFKIRNSDNTKTTYAIYLLCETGNTCSELKILDNDIQLYGKYPADNSYQDNGSAGIGVLGASQGLFILRNTLRGLNTQAHSGINVATVSTAQGAMQDIHIADNTLTGWNYTALAVSLNDDGGTGTMERVRIYRNYISGDGTTYGRGITVSGYVSHGNGDYKYISRHNNTEIDLGIGGNWGGNYGNAYRNIMARNRTGSCPPADPENFDSDYADEDPYFGEASCTGNADHLWDWADFPGEWGAPATLGSGRGRSAAGMGSTLLNGKYSAIFNNTIHDINQVGFGTGGSSDADTAELSHQKFVLNIVSETNHTNQGVGWTSVSGSTGCDSAYKPWNCCGSNPPGTATCTDHWMYTLTAGDSKPPGNPSYTNDCPLQSSKVEADHMLGNQIQHNVVYNSADSKFFCHTNDPGNGGPEQYTLAQAQAGTTPGTGGDDWNVSLMEILYNSVDDPKFVDADAAIGTVPNLKLQQDSSAKDMLDGDTWPCTINSATATYTQGQSVRVTDALFLGNPCIIPEGESNDDNCVGEVVKTASGNVARVASITYDVSGTLDDVTFDRDLYVVQNEGIHLWYADNSPDAGAEEYTLSEVGKGLNIKGVIKQ